MTRRSRKPTWVTLCAALLLLTAATAEAGKQPWVEDDRLAFGLTDLQGNPVASSDERFAGKVLFVTLWATWCPPCLTEIPTLVELQDEYGERGLVVVAIAFEAEEEAETRRQRLREFAEQQGIDYLVLDGGLPEEFGAALPGVRDVRGFPVEILVDRSGRVASARNGYGFKKKWARNLRQEIETLLGTEAGERVLQPPSGAGTGPGIQ